MTGLDMEEDSQNPVGRDFEDKLKSLSRKVEPENVRKPIRVVLTRKLKELIREIIGDVGTKDKQEFIAEIAELKMKNAQLRERPAEAQRERDEALARVAKLEQGTQEAEQARQRVAELEQGARERDVALQRAVELEDAAEQRDAALRRTGELDARVAELEKAAADDSEVEAAAARIAALEAKLESVNATVADAEERARTAAETSAQASADAESQMALASKEVGEARRQRDSAGARLGDMKNRLGPMEEELHRLREAHAKELAGLLEQARLLDVALGAFVLVEEPDWAALGARLEAGRGGLPAGQGDGMAAEIDAARKVTERLLERMYNQKAGVGTIVDLSTAIERVEAVERRLQEAGG